MNFRLDNRITDINTGALINIEKSSLSLRDIFIGIFDYMQPVVAYQYFFPSMDFEVSLHGSLVEIDDLPQLVLFSFPGSQNYRSFEEVRNVKISQNW